MKQSIQEVSERGMIPLNRPLSDILETAKRVPGFITPERFTEEIRGMPSEAICRYHNQYGHTTDRCKHLRMLVDRMISGGKLGQFVKWEKEDATPGKAITRMISLLLLLRVCPNKKYT